MIDQTLLDAVIRVELGLLVLAVGLFFTHGAWLAIFGRRLVRETTIGRAALIAALDRERDSSQSSEGGPAIASAEIETLRRLPKELVAILFLEISRNVSGSSGSALRGIADTVGLTRRARKLCRSRRWRRRLVGARILCQLGEPDRIVSTLLRDPHAPIRAQAAEWAAIFPSVTLIDEMLVLLGDPETLSRFAVQDALLRMGSVVIDPLAMYLNRSKGTAAEAGMKVASAMPDGRFLESAMRFSGDESPELRAAAAIVLGAVAGERPAHRLIELLEDTSEDVRSEAARALGRMQHWPAASKLASLLGDSSWNVRHGAGLALRAIGGPGVLLLRRATSASDPFAADMAQLIIGLPESVR